MATRVGPLGWLSRPLFRWSAGILASVVLGVLAFEALDISVFRRIGMAHEYCYLREPKLIWLHVISDVLIGVAYVSISATLGYLVYKASRGIPFHGVFLAFGLFIVSCGLTHFMEVWVIWEPVYWLSGYVKVVTAAASVATAVALFPLVPKIFRLIEAARRSAEHQREVQLLNEELERFNYSVAHDLRGPLRGIAGFNQALQEDCGHELSSLAKGYLERMQCSVGKMDALISGLLEYASIGQQQIHLRRVELAEVIRGTLALMDGELETRKAEVLVPSDLPAVLGDPTLLQVVFQNLIGNGIKFVASGMKPKVELSWSRQSNARRITIFVTDNGVGIPEESRAKIFEMFERCHPEHEGTGIGLPMVQRAIERMNGAIRVESAPTGSGTRFAVELPAA